MRIEFAFGFELLVLSYKFFVFIVKLFDLNLQRPGYCFLCGPYFLYLQCALLLYLSYPFLHAILAERRLTFELFDTFSMLFQLSYFLLLHYLDLICELFVRLFKLIGIFLQFLHFSLYTLIFTLKFTHFFLVILDFSLALLAYYL